MLAARVEPKNAPQESEKTDNFKPLVFRQFQPGVDRVGEGALVASLCRGLAPSLTLPRKRGRVVTSGVNFTQTQRFEFPYGVVSASSPDPVENATVLGPIKAKPFGWPRRRGQP